MVLLQGHLTRDCSVIYFLDKYETSCVAVSPGGCVLSWLWTFTLQLFLVRGFFLIMVGGILRMLPRIIYIQYIYIFFRALNVSWDSSEDVKRHSVDTQTNMHFQFTDLHADTRSHTQALKTSDQSLGEFLCHAGSFIQRGSGYEQTLSQTQSQTFFILALLFLLVLFSFVFVVFFFLFCFF